MAFDISAARLPLRTPATADPGRRYSAHEMQQVIFGTPPCEHPAGNRFAQPDTDSGYSYLILCSACGELFKATMMSVPT